MKAMLIATGLLFLAACAQEPSTPYSRVTQETLNTGIVGQKLFYEGNYMVISADGTVEGTFRGGFNGTWSWVDGYWCRDVPGIEPVSDCQLLEMSGQRVRATRDKGNGRSFVYTLGS